MAAAPDEEGKNFEWFYHGPTHGECSRAKPFEMEDSDAINAAYLRHKMDYMRDAFEHKLVNGKAIRIDFFTMHYVTKGPGNNGRYRLERILMHDESMGHRRHNRSTAASLASRKAVSYGDGDDSIREAVMEPYPSAPAPKERIEDWLRPLPPTASHSFCVIL
jgi:hypothetical protein